MPNRPKRRNAPKSRRNNNNPGKPGPQDKLDRKQLAEQYGYALAFLKSDDELFQLFQHATKNNWSVSKFQSELLDTKWFKHHSATWRQAQALKFSDPGEWQSRMSKMYQQLQSQAALNSAVISNKTLRQMSENALMMGWTDDQINDHMSKYVQSSEGGHYGGNLASIEDTVRQTAFRNGINLSQDSMKHWMRNIVQGQMTMEDYVNHVRATAARTFKGFSKEINGGMDLMDVASPYLQSASEILELAPNKVDLFDPRIRHALTHKDEKGNTSPMGLADFEQSLRSDPRWRHTQNATESVMDAAYNVARMMGAMA